jgi:uncharacterized membrane protein YedE/YeeE
MLSAFGSGLLFGIGLWLSGMANPRKVLDFLDITGDWDPSLLLVMAGALAVTLAFFRPVMKKRQIETGKTKIDPALIAGALIFGIGWGIAGYCPGPALTALSNLGLEAFVFVGAMIAGGLAHKLAFD